MTVYGDISVMYMLGTNMKCLMTTITVFDEILQYRPHNMDTC